MSIIPNLETATDAELRWLNRCAEIVRRKLNRNWRKRGLPRPILKGEIQFMRTALEAKLKSERRRAHGAGAADRA